MPTVCASEPVRGSDHDDLAAEPGRDAVFDVLARERPQYESRGPLFRRRRWRASRVSVDHEYEYPSAHSSMVATMGSRSRGARRSVCPPLTPRPEGAVCRTKDIWTIPSPSRSPYARSGFVGEAFCMTVRPPSIRTKACDRRRARRWSSFGFPDTLAHRYSGRSRARFSRVRPSSGASGCGVSTLVVAPTIPRLRRLALDPAASGRDGAVSVGRARPDGGLRRPHYRIRGTARGRWLRRCHRPRRAQHVRSRRRTNSTRTSSTDGTRPTCDARHGRRGGGVPRLHLSRRKASREMGVGARWEQLGGVLVSEWPVKDDCENVCRVVFSIQATRVDKEDDE